MAVNSSESETRPSRQILHKLRFSDRKPIIGPLEEFQHANAVLAREQFHAETGLRLHCVRDINLPDKENQLVPHIYIAPPIKKVLHESEYELSEMVEDYLAAYWFYLKRESFVTPGKHPYKRIDDLIENTKNIFEEIQKIDDDLSDFLRGKNLQESLVSFYFSLLHVREMTLKDKQYNRYIKPEVILIGRLRHCLRNVAPHKETQLTETQIALVMFGYGLWLPKTLASLRDCVDEQLTRLRSTFQDTKDFARLGPTGYKIGHPGVLGSRPPRLD